MLARFHSLVHQKGLSFFSSLFLLVQMLDIVCQRKTESHPKEHDCRHRPRLFEMLYLSITANTIQIIHYKKFLRVLTQILTRRIEIKPYVPILAARDVIVPKNTSPLTERVEPVLRLYIVNKYSVNQQKYSNEVPWLPIFMT